MTTSLPQDELKRAAAAEAVRFVEDGMTLGLGTGSTVSYLLSLLAERIERGELKNISGISTSDRTTEACERLGIPLTDFGRHPKLDLAIDGADEVDPNLNLIKGLGGALLREKIVAQAAQRLVIIIDEGKLVDRLGTRAPLPVEVLPLGWQTHIPFFDALGAQARVRLSEEDSRKNPIVTDNGNYILDCEFELGIIDPEEVDRALSARAGILESGLFLKMTDTVLVAEADGISTMTAVAAADQDGA